MKTKLFLTSIALLAFALNVHAKHDYKYIFDKKDFQSQEAIQKKASEISGQLIEECSEMTYSFVSGKLFGIITAINTTEKNLELARTKQEKAKYKAELAKIQYAKYLFTCYTESSEKALKDALAYVKELRKEEIKKNQKMILAVRDTNGEIKEKKLGDVYVKIVNPEKEDSPVLITDNKLPDFISIHRLPSYISVVKFSKKVENAYERGSILKWPNSLVNLGKFILSLFKDKCSKKALGNISECMDSYIESSESGKTENRIAEIITAVEKVKDAKPFVEDLKKVAVVLREERKKYVANEDKDSNHWRPFGWLKKLVPNINLAGLFAKDSDRVAGDKNVVMITPEKYDASTRSLIALDLFDNANTSRRNIHPKIAKTSDVNNHAHAVNPRSERRNKYFVLKKSRIQTTMLITGAPVVRNRTQKTVKIEPVVIKEKVTEDDFDYYENRLSLFSETNNISLEKKVVLYSISTREQKTLFDILKENQYVFAGKKFVIVSKVPKPGLIHLGESDSKLYSLTMIKIIKALFQEGKVKTYDKAEADARRYN